MLPQYMKLWLPNISCNNETIVEEHMSIFWSFLELFPVDGDAKDLVMRLFAVTLHGDAKIWLNGLTEKSVKSMADFEEIFLDRWSTKEAPNVLCNMKEDETYKGEQDLPHDSTKDSKDFIEEVSHEDEVLVSALPFDEVIQASTLPAQEEENMVSHFPFQDFDDALFYDSESEEVLEKPFDVLDPSCYDNIDEFIHVGRRKWDVIGLDGGPIYDIQGHFQLLPLQQPCVIATNPDVWQQEDDMITNLFQQPKDDLLQHSHEDFWSYPGDFGTCSFEHLDLFYEENFQPLLCSNFDKREDMVFLEQDFCDKNFQPPPLSTCHFTTDMVGGSPHYGHFPFRGSCFNLWFVVGLFNLADKINNPLVGRKIFSLGQVSSLTLHPLFP
jgi:hypothetical protein